MDERPRTAVQVLVRRYSREPHGRRRDVEDGALLVVERHHVLHRLGEHAVLLTARAQLLLDGFALDHMLLQERAELFEIAFEAGDGFRMRLAVLREALRPAAGALGTGFLGIGHCVDPAPAGRAPDVAARAM